MKLEKLLTLSQFIDNMRLNGLGTEPETIDFIFKYNDFLRQPLTKEMFVNPHPEPKSISGHGDKDVIGCVFDTLYHKCQEAENKVIFDGDLIGDYFVSNCVHYHFADMLSQNKVLSDLANGKLTLKNVTI